MVLIVSVCAELFAPIAFWHVTSESPAQDEVEEMSCRYNPLSAALAVMVTSNGPLVTVNVYHPSLLKLLGEQPEIAGLFCVASVIVPLLQGPLIVKLVAVEQFEP